MVGKDILGNIIFCVHELNMNIMVAFEKKRKEIPGCDSWAHCLLAR